MDKSILIDQLDNFPIDIPIQKEEAIIVASNDNHSHDFTLITSNEYKQTLQDFVESKKKYTMDFMIDRLYDKLTEQENKSKTSVDPPQIVIENKKTCIVNFKKICAQLNRHNTYLKEYIENEFSVKTNVNANGSLILIGVYKSNKVIAIIKKYIMENIACKECKSCLTDIIRENRITYLKCNRCLSKKAI